MRVDASRVAAVYRAPGRQRRPQSGYASGRRQATRRLGGAVVLLAVLARAVTPLASGASRVSWSVCIGTRSGQRVPALAWFLLSSLVPLALGVTALAAVALGDYAEAQALSVRISKPLPNDVHDQLVTLILRTKEQSPLLIAASIIGMVWVSSGAVGVIERCLLRLLARPSTRGRPRQAPQPGSRRGGDRDDHADGCPGHGRH